VYFLPGSSVPYYFSFAIHDFDVDDSGIKGTLSVIGPNRRTIFGSEVLDMMRFDNSLGQGIKHMKYIARSHYRSHSKLYFGWLHLACRNDIIHLYKLKVAPQHSGAAASQWHLQAPAGPDEATQTTLPLQAPVVLDGVRHMDLGPSQMESHILLLFGNSSAYT
jgi:hypothetical protein